MAPLRQPERSGARRNDATQVQAEREERRTDARLEQSTAGSDRQGPPLAVASGIGGVWEHEGKAGRERVSDRAGRERGHERASERERTREARAPTRGAVLRGPHASPFYRLAAWRSCRNDRRQLGSNREYTACDRSMLFFQSLRNIELLRCRAAKARSALGTCSESGTPGQA